MGEAIHFIPVGFDFERLVRPVSGGSLDCDRVILLHSVEGVGDPRAEELVDKMLSDITQHLDLQDIAVDTREVSNIFDYQSVYRVAFESMVSELELENRVYVNISSMPRTVAFAFATAASAIVIENPEYRNSVSIYYVAAENYLVLDIVEELQREVDFLSKLLEDGEHEDVKERINAIEATIRKYWRHGVTEGVQKLDGTNFVEIPAPPMADLSEDEESILVVLNRHRSVPSQSELAELVADYSSETIDDSFENSIAYYAKKLERKGYITSEMNGLEKTISITKMGELWAETHADFDRL